MDISAIHLFILDVGPAFDMILKSKRVRRGSRKPGKEVEDDERGRAGDKSDFYVMLSGSMWSVQVFKGERAEIQPPNIVALSCYI